MQLLVRAAGSIAARVLQLIDAQKSLPVFDNLADAITHLNSAT